MTGGDCIYILLLRMTGGDCIYILLLRMTGGDCIYILLLRMTVQPVGDDIGGVCVFTKTRGHNAPGKTVSAIYYLTFV